MGQQPNIEVGDESKPRSGLTPGPAVKWRSNKPGVPSGPADQPDFSHTGPDPGWALKLVAQTDLPDDDPKLGAVVTGLVLARAAALGRAPVGEDIDAALVLCGYGEEATDEIVERRHRWLAAVPHERRPGETAVSEVDAQLLISKPEQIRYAYRLSEKS